MKVSISDMRKVLNAMEALNVDSFSVDINSDGMRCYHENSEGVVTVDASVFHSEFNPAILPSIQWTAKEVDVMDEDGITPLKFKEVTKAKNLL